MKVFEHGVLKDGLHRLARAPFGLLNDSEFGPILVERHTSTVGEIQELSREEVKQRDWLYSAMTRRKIKTEAGEKVWAYFPRKPEFSSGDSVPANLWLYPRQNGRVYRLTALDGATFEGSLREILEQLHRDQRTPDGPGRFDKATRRRLKGLGRLNYTQKKLGREFFLLLQAGARMVQIWPASKDPRRIVL